MDDDQTVVEAELWREGVPPSLREVATSEGMAHDAEEAGEDAQAVRALETQVGTLRSNTSPAMGPLLLLSPARSP